FATWYDLRTASFALGALGRVYEQKKQYDFALKFTHQAQLAAGQISAPDSLYRWQWQAGRIYRATGKREEAKVAYRQAIASLQSIRGDIAVANQNLQLDFRDEVEPVYRQLLEILLDEGTPRELQEAIQVFEGLQLSELQNFFGDDCVEIIDAIKQPQIILAKTNTVVIHSIILKNQSYLILQLPSGTNKSYPINISQSQLQKKILKWRNELEDISSYRYLDLAKELYKLLIQPIENELELVQPNNLVFINDGLFRNVPIGALYDGQKFLLEKYPLSVSLGLNFITQSQSFQQWRSLTFGLTLAIPPFDSLPNVVQETQEVQTILGGSRYLNDDFTFDNLQKQISKKNYSVVHLATHGRFGGNADSAFLQAFDQQISLAELENLLDSSQKSIELLTLSACQTAAGNDRATLGLAGVAVRSGVKSTLGTLWFVNDQATVELITDFYRYLEEEMTKTEALRKAQLNQIATSGSHPSIWASFVLVGNWL
ncbi:CHAT domain-containing protein, partial [Chroococcus sp. FPU101]|uniref:CHAT domain-containing protein n=1 Tax=Chroococcus sp. FPU101 TaxID=1974212 RepID=UPI001A8C7386